MPRRSSRSRSKPTSSYDDALQAAAASKKKMVIADEDASDQDEDMPDKEEDARPETKKDLFADESDDDDDDDSFAEAPKVKVMRKPSSKSPPKTKKKGKRSAAAATTTTTNKKTLHTALQQVSKQVLEKKETTENSLLAALLACAAPIRGIDSVDDDRTADTTRTTDQRRISPYTPQLVGVVQALLTGSNARYCQQPSPTNNDDEKDDDSMTVATTTGPPPSPDDLHRSLFALLFRSVGGSLESAWPFEATTALEDVTDEEWDPLVTQVVQDMMSSSEVGLWTATPPVLDPTKKKRTRRQVALEAFREIYQEFWYRLGQALLSSAGSSSTTTNAAFSSNRFQVEGMRSLLERLTELVLVGQPDLRSAATVAIWQLSLASLERTVVLQNKRSIAHRQWQAATKSNAKKSTSSSKTQALVHSMETWKRHQTELEDMVESLVLEAVFSHRYRDSNPSIRVSSLSTLSELMLLRPDRLLQNKYLKYVGWMLSDKVPMVRCQALQSLYAPLRAHQLQQKNEEHEHDATTTLIPLKSVQHVCVRFLNRLLECIDDLSVDVQEWAMKVMLQLLHHDLLDEWDDDHGWDGVNLKALDPDTSPVVRKQALYFVLEQLDAFDDHDDDETQTQSQSQSKKSRRGGGTTADPSEKKQADQIDGIASWIAHKLSDGPIEVDNIRVHLTNHVMESLREMPEHEHLVTNWSALFKAIRNETPNTVSAGRGDLAKQRVLLQMLACGADLEVGASAETSTKTASKKKKKQTKKNNASSQAESLSLPLLKNLPALLTKYKGDVLALRALTQLPRYLVAGVFALPSRKSDFSALVKNLCLVFMETTDEKVQHNVVQALAALMKGDHARVLDVKNQVQVLSTALQERLMELFQESEDMMEPDASGKKKKTAATKRKRRRGGGSSGSTITSHTSDSLLSTTPPETELEHSIAMCLRRLRILVKFCPPSILFGKAEEDQDQEIESLCTTISEAVGKRLQIRQPILETASDQSIDGEKSMCFPDIWKETDLSIHAEVATVVAEATDLLLASVAWKLKSALEEKDRMAGLGEEMDEQDMLVMRLRERLLKLLGLCFDQHLEEQEGTIIADEHIDFANAVQTTAGTVASDIRCLFPREWAKAADPVLRTLALTDDAQLIGGFGRYVQSRTEELKELAGEATNTTARVLVRDLLMPLTRGLTANWTDGNRKEAGIVLGHITGSGKEAYKTVHSTARLLKKINPVRFLEAQMACLRMSFEDWINNEPEELETDQPTEEELEYQEEAEKRHTNQFAQVEQQAAKLSSSLGVGKIRDNTLARAILSFMQEGVRYAFEGDRVEEDDLLLGSRLPFLFVLTKYATWMKRNRAQLDELASFIDQKERAMGAHPEYDEVHEDDLAALAAFKTALGIRQSTHRNNNRSSVSFSMTVEEDDEAEVSDTASQPGMPFTPSPTSTATPASRRRRSSASGGSQKSRYSTQSMNLSPLPEEENEETPQKRRRLASSLTASSPIEEEDDSTTY